MPTDTHGRVLPICQLPAASQAVTFTTSAQSAAFAADTKFIRVVADAAAHIAVGDNPTATATSMFLPANSVEFFGVKGGDKIAAYDGSS